MILFLLVTPATHIILTTHGIATTGQTVDGRIRLRLVMQGKDLLRHYHHRQINQILAIPQTLTILGNATMLVRVGMATVTIKIQCQ